MMKELLEKDNSLKPPKIGEIVEGTIVERGRAAVFLDLGKRGTGIIYGKELQEAKEVLRGLNTGDKVFAKIIDLDNEEGYIELSAKDAREELVWQELKKKKENKEKITVKILGANKGGLLTKISGILAFLPVSQLAPENYPKVEGGDPAKILKELQKFVGQEMAVLIFDLDPNTKKLILSERALKSKEIQEHLKKYKEGEVVEGEITALTSFGAFLRFGKEEIEGLIPLSEICQKETEKSIAEILKPKQKVRAKIIKISGDKIYLSLKALQNSSQ